MNLQEEKSGSSVGNEQGKEAYIDKIWKKADMRIAIEIGCIMAGVIAALVVWHVFKDELLEALVEACSIRLYARKLPL